MFGLATVLFFSVTGMTLNHPDWFGNLERRSQSEGQVELRWLHITPPASPSSRPPAGERTTTLRRARPSPITPGRSRSSRSSSTCGRRTGSSGALADFRVDENECSVSFKGPGYSADAFIDRSTGHYNLIQTSHGFVAVINDLHKGRDTGPVWSAVIDISAIVLTIISLTGLVLIFFLKLRRRPGLVVALVGTVVLVVVGWFWVP